MAAAAKEDSNQLRTRGVVEPKNLTENYRDVMMTEKTDSRDVDQKINVNDSDGIAAVAATLSSTTQSVTFSSTRREQVRRERHGGAATLQQGALLDCPQVGDIVTLKGSSTSLYTTTEILNTSTRSVRSTSCDSGACVNFFIAVLFVNSTSL